MRRHRILCENLAQRVQQRDSYRIQRLEMRQYALQRLFHRQHGRQIVAMAVPHSLHRIVVTAVSAAVFPMAVAAVSSAVSSVSVAAVTAPALPVMTSVMLSVSVACRHCCSFLWSRRYW